MSNPYITRELTAEESEALLRALHLKLGKQSLVDAALSAIAESGVGIFHAEKKPYYMSDEDVARMHPRQAAALMKVAADDRGAVVRHAHFLMNVTGGNLSGNIYTAAQHLAAAGSAEALMEQDREDNAKLMGGAMRAR